VQVRHIGQGIKGFYRVARYALRWEMVHKDAQRRLEMLKFWHAHGLAGSLEAFKVSRRTLYAWKAKWKAEGSLRAGSTAPKRGRRRNWAPAVIAQIRGLRTEHPNLAKEKIHPFLLAFCEKHRLRCPAVRTIGRLIGDAGDKMRHSPVRIRPNGKPQAPRSTATRKPKHFVARHPGHCVALDTIEWQLDGARRYLITFTDLHSHFAFAWATRSHARVGASHFFRLIEAIFPYRIEAVLTDNGSQFKHHFAQALQRHTLSHWHTYPKTPKMNAHCERFNRTVQDEFASYHENLLFTDLPAFNLKLLVWLDWYNCQRPHFSLTEPVPLRKTPKLLSPLQFLFKHHQCNMYWPDTES